ncbi:hypothetical protein ACVWXO_008124 [Bradyrhizobium sp. LM2.7]
MRVRWIALVFVIGAYFAWRDTSSIEAYATVFGCLLLYSLRAVEVRIERVEGKMPDRREPKKQKKLFYGFEVPKVPDETFTYPSEKTPQHQWEPMVSMSLAKSDFLTASYLSTPLMMRKRGSRGDWVYREPTEKEIQDYIHAEAWA